MDNEEWWPEDLFAELGSLGFLGVTVPEKYGGVGLGLLESGLILQAFSRWNHAVGLSWVAHDNLCLNNIYRNGSEEIREQYLPNLCSGNDRLSWIDRTWRRFRRFGFNANASGARW